MEDVIFSFSILVYVLQVQYNKHISTLCSLFFLQLSILREEDAHDLFWLMLSATMSQELAFSQVLESPFQNSVK